MSIENTTGFPESGPTGSTVTYIGVVIQCKGMKEAVCVYVQSLSSEYAVYSIYSYSNKKNEAGVENDIIFQLCTSMYSYDNILMKTNNCSLCIHKF